MTDRTIIIGAGPAGLSAAHELGRLEQPALVVEQDAVVGGISRTVSYNGYRFDIGGHRFFTKVPMVDAMWHELLGDEMLERSRLSRIRYNGVFFDYPLRPVDALTKIGVVEATRIVLSYLRSQMSWNSDERTFEDWIVNRFGRRLYEIFFKSYTEKVWGLPCNQIGAEWAAQRIKSLDLKTAIWSALVGHGSKRGEIVTTLIDRFKYPRLGPGMMWEKCREQVLEFGINTETSAEVTEVHHARGRVTAVTVKRNGFEEQIDGTSFISSMPIPLLVEALRPAAPDQVLQAASKLSYRDFLIVVLMVDRAEVFPDNWIYIHEPSVSVGRVQNFKNWSPDMVPDPSQTTLGLEYFVNASGELWNSSDEDLGALGVREMAELGLIDAKEVVDHTVVRVRRAYPVYDGDYHEALKVIRLYLAGFENLQMIGRNGQHRYNNQDHAMVAGILAARNVAGENHDVWAVNVEQTYHEKGPIDDRLTPSQAPGVPLEDVLAEAFARYDPVALGGAVGFVAAGTIFLATAVLLIKGGEPLGPSLSLLGNYLLGYNVSWAGAVLGAAEAGLVGGLFGGALAGIINLLVGMTETSVFRECQLSCTLDFFDRGNE